MTAHDTSDFQLFRNAKNLPKPEVHAILIYFIIIAMDAHCDCGTLINVSITFLGINLNVLVMFLQK